MEPWPPDMNVPPAAPVIPRAGGSALLRWLLCGALLLRGVVPVGVMIAPLDGLLRLQLCTGHAPVAAAPAALDESERCDFAFVLGMGAVAPDEASPLRLSGTTAPRETGAPLATAVGVMLAPRARGPPRFS